MREKERKREERGEKERTRTCEPLPGRVGFDAGPRPKGRRLV